MYSRPIIYKVYSILTVVFALLSFISGIVSFSNSLSFPPNMSFLDSFIPVMKTVSLVSGILSLFLAYINCSSMFSFAEMIEYELSESQDVFKKKPFVLSPSVYRGVGIIMFVINILALLPIVFVVFSLSFWFGILTLVLCALYGVIAYITYYCKYKGFGDVLEIISTKDVSEELLARLKKNNTTIMHGYCLFLYIVSIIFAAITIICCIVLTGVIFTVFGVFGWLVLFCILCVSTVLLLCLAVEGCYIDNLGKMVEHYMIKYKLI